MKYSQYGEESIIESFFNGKRQGFVLDVGAADGVSNSNSRYLITEFEWSGALIEPHPSYFSKLEYMYKKHGNIKLFNLAVCDQVGTMPFFQYGSDENGQVSTLSQDFKKRVSLVHGDEYHEPIMVNVVTLESIFENLPFVDFLSVDCEGVDMLVLKSNNWEKYRPTLLCVEHSMPKEELDLFMRINQYNLLDRTIGNSFYVNNRKV
jgi:FkbM family methyltransferase